MSPPRVDLRSDTVTLPTPEMRAAMARAEVGDDVYREDPTTRLLEETAATLLGKEAAIFVPSGTMANQIALLLHAPRGAEVIVGEGAHLCNFEAGAAAAWAGVQCVVAGRGGVFSAAELEPLLRPASEMYPETRLVCIENTHNASGGTVFPQREILFIAERARSAALALHLDGARLWNVAAATNTSEAELAQPFDTVSACFSKGLGAPVGSVLAGSAELMRAARRFRKMLGGAMRQSGVLAAAALYALHHHRARLVDDHRNARRIADILASSPHVTSRAEAVQTNMVLVRLSEPRAQLVARAAEGQGVLVHAMAPNAIRLVTHLDITTSSAEAAAERLREVIGRVMSAA
ncbi:MAG TPA: GntG family PLP-dependent aldolase [Polyangiaceae bacterium]|nr:GntG family PLP-dependent aldolase [Polyangiaceae bacterium]